MEKFEEIYRNHLMRIEGTQDGGIFKLTKASFRYSNGAEILLPLIQSSPEFHVNSEKALGGKFSVMRKIIDELLDGTQARITSVNS